MGFGAGGIAMLLIAVLLIVAIAALVNSLKN